MASFDGMDGEARVARPRIAFVLDGGSDPDERLENAILWKLLSDRLGGMIVADEGRSQRLPAGTTHAFGRMGDVALWAAGEGLAYPRADRDPRYWAFPTFLGSAGRSIDVAPYEEAGALVAAVHARGRDAFVKATTQKRLAMVVGRGETLGEAVGALAYSFVDGGPRVVVQERVEMEWEYRVFVVGHEPVTGAGVLPDATPLDNRARFDPAMRRRPGEATSRGEAEVARAAGYHRFARAAAIGLAADGCTPDYVMDLCTIAGRPAIVELNPGILGRAGLYACAAGALVDATLAGLGLGT